MGYRERNPPEELTVDWAESQNGVTPSFKSVNLKEFIEMDIPPRENLLSPWLPKQGMAMIYAPRGIGKTYFALEVAIAVATGGRFLGWHAPKPRKVIYIDGEMPASDLQERLKHITKKCGDMPYNLAIMTPDLQPSGMPNLSDPRSIMMLDSFIKEADLIIVDNISTLCRSGKENEAESWDVTQNWGLSNKASGKTILFIHHAGKSGKQRGTSKREDVLDSIINLQRPSDYKASEGARFEIKFEKSRCFTGKDAEEMEVQLEITDEEGTKWWYETKEDELAKDILKLRKEGKSQTEIAGILKVNKSTICRKEKEMRENGIDI